MGLKIGIDARQLESASWGVGRVLANLLRVWSQNSRNHRLVLYFKKTIPDLDYLQSPGFEKKILPPFLGIESHRVWEQLALPCHIKKDKLDVFFSAAYIMPLAATCPTVVYIHDISFQVHPEWFAFRDQLELRGFTFFSVLRAAKIVCCSNHTKREIMSQYGDRLEDKIRVMYHAPEKHFRVGDGDRVAAHYGISQPYFLFVGYLFKRRNILLLVRAFKKVLDNHPGYRLVLIGRDKELGDSLKRTLQELDLQDKVKRFDYVSEADLLAFYQAAFCLVHPSLYEGFGLPVIEAMACGTPVMLANAEGMVEIAEGAALVVDPLTEAHLAQAMTALIENPDRRRELALKGLERARKLSWEKTADAIMDVIEDAAKTP
jgi:glycosyltransferase involved in cell wall biosynthesis